MILLNDSPVNTTLFPDNTSQVWKLPEFILNESNWVHITWKFSHEGEFMQLAQLKELMDQHEIRCCLRLKYLPYGRQDKCVSNKTTFALIPFSKLLNSLNFDEVIIHDPHSVVALALIKNSRAVYPVEEVMGIAYDLKTDLFCYPDAGAVDKYTGGDDVQKEIYDYPYIYGDKVRDQETGYITKYELQTGGAGLFGKKILIVDDICDGGMTFKILTKDLLEAGAEEVNLFVTHGLFSKGLKTLRESGINRIFTQDGEASELQNQIVYSKNID